MRRPCGHATLIDGLTQLEGASTGLDYVTLRAATLDDLDGIAAIYNQLWCNTLRNRGDVEAADFCARFNIAM